MQYTCVLYICYIVQMPFYESIVQRRIETVNEILLLCICYHFTVWNELIVDIPCRETLGTLMIGFVIALLAFNSIIILFVNYVHLRKLFRRAMNRRAHKRMLQKKENVSKQAILSLQRQDPYTEGLAVD